MRPVLLDLFCGEGGAGEGYRRAGFDVVGVDVVRREYRPGRFIQADLSRVSTSRSWPRKWGPMPSTPALLARSPLPIDAARAQATAL